MGKAGCGCEDEETIGNGSGTDPANAGPWSKAWRPPLSSSHPNLWLTESNNPIHPPASCFELDTLGNRQTLHMTRGTGLNGPDEAGHFGEVIGLEHKPAPEGMSMIDIPLNKRLCNRHGTIHGGVIMTLMDAAGLWADASMDSPPRAATVSVTCNFLRGAQLEDVDILRATAQVIKRGRALYFSSISVHAGIDGPIIASGQGIYSYSTK